MAAKYIHLGILPTSVSHSSRQISVYVICVGYEHKASWQEEVISLLWEMKCRLTTIKMRMVVKLAHAQHTFVNAEPRPGSSLTVRKYHRKDLFDIMQTLESYNLHSAKLDATEALLCS